MKKIKNAATSILFLLAGFTLLAQQQFPGNLDVSFNTTDVGYGEQVGASSTVYSVVKQPDQKILIGGNFTTYNNVSRVRIARLNEDGTIDASFNPGTGFTGGTPPSVRAIALQPDGKILVGGLFTEYNGVARNRIVRLNADGTLDTSFDPGTGTSTTASHYINSIVLQPDGKILIGGLFTEYNGTARSRIARLNEDGTLDTSFDPGTGTTGTATHYVYSVALQADGKILIGGSFTGYNGTTGINRIARLNTDGTLDTTFDVGTGAASNVRKIAVQEDGKIIIGGEFSSFNGTSVGRITRINPDGTPDAAFNTAAGTGFTSSSGTPSVHAIYIQADGKILAGGETFIQYNGVPRNKITRLNADGSLDTSFDVGTGINTGIYSFELQPDDKILIGGNYSSYNGVARRNVTRLNTDGIIDYTFNPETGINGSVYTTVKQSDGKILAGGYFTHVNGVARRNIVRLNLNGSVDTTFNPGASSQGSGIVEIIKLQPDGKILIGGYFTSYNGVQRNGIARLNADGTLDTSFDPGGGVTGTGAQRINAIALQDDGKIIIGGIFNSYDGGVSKGIARLNADGSVDPSFDSGTGTSNSAYVYSIVLQSDGKIVIAGDFTTYNELPANQIARLNADGTLDASFQANVGEGVKMFGSPGSVYAIGLTSDEKIIAAGLFDNYNDETARSIIRLNTDGTLDAAFSSGSGTSWMEIRALTIQPDEKIVIGGNFNSYNGSAVNRIARLESNGDFDTSFDPGAGASAIVYALFIQTDGKIVIAGDFTNYDGTGRNRLARIFGTECSAVTSIDEQQLCGVSSYVWIDGNTYTTDNHTATYTLSTVSGGCDSIVTLNLTFLQTATGTDVITACAPYTWIDGNTYLSSNNTATYTLSGAAANTCDSIVTLDLTISTVDSTVSVNGTVLTANQDGAAYQWIDCDNSNAPVPGATSQSFTPASNGSYAVTVTTDDCTKTSACIVVNSVGLEEAGFAGLSIYPNPASSNVTIVFTEKGSYSLSDVTGKEMKKGILSGDGTTTIDVSLLNAGVYFIELTTGANTSITEKIVKQ